MDWKQPVYIGIKVWQSDGTLEADLEGAANAREALTQNMESTMPKATATSTTPTNDPVIALLARHQSLVDRFTNEKEWTESKERNIVDEMTCIDEQLATVKATTAEGALAALHRLKAELQEFVFSDDMPEVQSQLYQGLIEGVEAYLRQQFRMAPVN